MSGKPGRLSCARLESPRAGAHLFFSSISTMHIPTKSLIKIAKHGYGMITFSRAATLSITMDEIEELKEDNKFRVCHADALDEFLHYIKENPDPDGLTFYKFLLPDFLSGDECE